MGTRLLLLVSCSGLISIIGNCYGATTVGFPDHGTGGIQVAVKLPGSCPALIIHHGRMWCNNGFQEGSSCYLHCKPGFRPSSWEASTCRCSPFGCRWSRKIPYCSKVHERAQSPRHSMCLACATRSPLYRCYFLCGITDRLTR